MSAEPITPSTAEVRADYIRDHTRNFDSFQVGRSLTSEQEFYAEKFDRWLREERAKALEEAADTLGKAVLPARTGLPLMLRAQWLRQRAESIRNEGNADG